MTGLAHRLDGRGETLLLLNGGLMSMAAWDGIAATLQAELRVLRCDFRGQLRSPGPPPADLDGHVADLVALLDDLDLAAVHVAGTSFGGQVGLLLAARHPARVRSLLVATVTDRPSSAFRAGAAAFAAACRGVAAGGDPAAVWDAMEASWFSAGWRSAHAAELAARRRQVALLPPIFFADAAALLEALDGFDLTPLLPRIACPTLVLAAALDQVMPPEAAARIAARIPGARAACLEGTGHALVVERPDAFARACLELAREPHSA